MLIEGRTITAHICNILFELFNITRQMLYLHCLVTSEYIILLARQLEGGTAPSMKMLFHQFFPSALDGQPLSLDSTSEPTVALNMGLCGLQSRSGNFEKRKPTVYSGNSTADRLTSSLGTVSTSLSWLPYEDFISVASCTNANSLLLQLQQNSFASFILQHALMHLQHLF